jgi:hypothetical protein
MRQAEPLRASELAREVPGEWVAVRDHEVIEVPDTLDSLVKDLPVRCISDVSVLGIPAEAESELVGLGWRLARLTGPYLLRYRGDAGQLFPHLEEAPSPETGGWTEVDSPRQLDPSDKALVEPRTRDGHGRLASDDEGLQSQ